MTPGAGRLLTRNIRNLMHARRCKAKDVAFYCKHSKPWISRLLADGHKKIAFHDLDRMADFFQVDVRDLFAPERRKSRKPYTGPERRKGGDRRQG